MDIPATVPEGEENSDTAGSGSEQQNALPSKQSATEAMSRISGIRKLKHATSVPSEQTASVPEYGVEVPKSEEFSAVSASVRFGE